jgi:hypothetical protein
MAQFVPNTTGNTVEVESLIKHIFEGIKTYSLFADEQSTILGPKTSLMIDNTITKGDITKTNELLSILYSMLQYGEDTRERIEIIKIQSSNNGERSFDIQVFCKMILNGEEKRTNIYINLCQGSNKVKRKENRAKKIAASAEKAIAEAQQLESSIEQLTDATEKLQLATEKAREKIHEAQAAEQRVEKAKQEKIVNYWVPKLQIMII